MEMLKRFLKSDFAAKIASKLIEGYIRLVDSTTRWEVIGYENFERAGAGRRGLILAFWHGRLLMAPCARRYTDEKVYMLISAHRDGDIIAQGVKSFGIEFIRGSSVNPKKPAKDKSGAPAVVQMSAALKEGCIVGFTPDGPRGPAERVQPGVVRIAQKTGAPVLPGAYSVSRAIELKTWDRFLLAAPFSKGVFIVGEPIYVDDTADPNAIENARARIENALNSVKLKADALTGRKPDNSAENIE